MDPCYFQDDKARCHVSRATMQWYADNNVRRLDWRAKAPTSTLGRIGSPGEGSSGAAKSIAQLMEWLQEEWRRIPVGVLQTLVESMADRVAAVIASRDYNGVTTTEQTLCTDAQLLFAVSPLLEFGQKTTAPSSFSLPLHPFTGQPPLAYRPYRYLRVGVGISADRYLPPDPSTPQLTFSKGGSRPQSGGHRKQYITLPPLPAHSLTCHNPSLPHPTRARMLGWFPSKEDDRFFPLPFAIPLPCATCTVSNDLAVDETLSPIIVSSSKVTTLEMNFIKREQTGTLREVITTPVADMAFQSSLAAAPVPLQASPLVLSALGFSSETYLIPLVTPISTVMHYREGGGDGQQECPPENTRQPVATSATLPPRARISVAPRGIEPGSPWWKTSGLTTTPQWPHQLVVKTSTRQATFGHCKQILIILDLSLYIRCAERGLIMMDLHWRDATEVILRLISDEYFVTSTRQKPQAYPEFELGIPWRADYNLSNSTLNVAVCAHLWSIYLPDLNIGVLKVDEASVEQRRNAMAGGGGGGNVRSPRKPTDKQHRPARFPRSKTTRLGNKPVRPGDKMEQSRNVRAGETGDPRENPSISDVVRHNSHLQKVGSDPRGYSTVGCDGGPVERLVICARARRRLVARADSYESRSVPAGAAKRRAAERISAGKTVQNCIRAVQKVYLVASGLCPNGKRAKVSSLNSWGSAKLMDVKRGENGVVRIVGVPLQQQRPPRYTHAKKVKGAPPEINFISSRRGGLYGRCSPSNHLTLHLLRTNNLETSFASTISKSCPAFIKNVTCGRPLDLMSTAEKKKLKLNRQLRQQIVCRPMCRHLQEVPLGGLVKSVEGDGVMSGRWSGRGGRLGEGVVAAVHAAGRVGPGREAGSLAEAVIEDKGSRNANDILSPPPPRPTPPPKTIHPLPCEHAMIYRLVLISSRRANAGEGNTTHVEVKVRGSQTLEFNALGQHGEQRGTSRCVLARDASYCLAPGDVTRTAAQSAVDQQRASLKYQIPLDFNLSPPEMICIILAPLESPSRTRMVDVRRGEHGAAPESKGGEEGTRYPRGNPRRPAEIRRATPPGIGRGSTRREASSITTKQQRPLRLQQVPNHVVSGFSDRTTKRSGLSPRRPVWHYSSESIVYIQISITPLDCQMIKEYVALSEDCEALRTMVKKKGGGGAILSSFRRSLSTDRRKRQTDYCRADERLKDAAYYCDSTLCLLNCAAVLPTQVMKFEVLRADEGVARYRAAPECRGGGKGVDAEKTPSIGGYVREDSIMRKSGGNPAGNRTSFALV
ncbi:hypothetical protein PR048_023024 [Dryococelus australis]|uniref:Uncharacterized protein n=1 Tax=Dryococelus australis TaxID=614101 RepID=A0ABQ9GSW7_9NEOP|nr:hypothetical protein PR048_023024 [Dryococelus australis]